MPGYSNLRICRRISPRLRMPPSYPRSNFSLMILPLRGEPRGPLTPSSSPGSRLLKRGSGTMGRLLGVMRAPSSPNKLDFLTLQLVGKDFTGYFLMCPLPQPLCRKSQARLWGPLSLSLHLSLMTLWLTAFGHVLSARERTSRYSLIVKSVANLGQMCLKNLYQPTHSPWPQRLAMWKLRSSWP